MKENNKEKRYFCDWWERDTYLGFKGTILMILIIFAVMFINFGIIYNVLVQINSDELNSYSESVYRHLDDIADSVICEGVGIDIQALPDDVVEYEIKGNGKEITFKYSLDNNKDMEFASSANMTVTLSENFEIISKESNYSSEEEYIADIKSQLSDRVIIAGFGIMIFVLIIVLFSGCIAARISKNRKYKDMFQN